MTVHHWLNDKLKQEIRDSFEPRYKRKLTDDEVILIAENLTGVMVVILRARYRKHIEEQKRLANRPRSNSKE